MIKVLIVDDSATTRHMLARLLTEGGQIEVVGQATSGPEAVEMTHLLKPDVITMDIVMPGMDGVDTTARIMNERPTPIIIISSLDDIRRSKISMDALNNGALAVLALPPLNSRDLSALASHLRETVLAVAKIKSVRIDARKQNLAAQARKTPPLPVRPNKTINALLEKRPPVEIVCIACSVGGPAALAQILGELSADFPLPILVTQHISPGFTEDLAAWLDDMSPLNVRVAKDFDQLQSRTVFIAPDDRHIGLRTRSHVLVSGNPPIKGFRPAATFMFESAAKVFKGASVAVILTGMGDDGLTGLKIHHEQGGIIIAQDEASSVVYGMPKAAVSNGLADLVLPLDKVAANLTMLAKGSQDNADDRPSR